MNEEIHVGKLLEELIRSNNLPISEVARKIKVNRRSLYNWFEKTSLRSYTLQRICYVLVYDFSVKLPDFLREEFLQDKNLLQSAPETKVEAEDEGINSAQFWMNKYIYLLEQYNQVLAKEINKQEKTTERKR
jgi:hypothetical protein